MKHNRFDRIEGEEIQAGIIKKRKAKETNRFKHIETGDNTKENIETTAKSGKRYFPCPKCNRNNHEDSLYCIYCGYVFPDVAEKTDSSLEPYEIKCPQCGKTCNRNQKSCLWCGYAFVPRDKDLLEQGEKVEIEVNGIKYSSDDRYLPSHIKQLLIKIKKGEYDPKEIASTVKVKREYATHKLKESADKKRKQITGLVLLIIGGLFLWAARIFVLFKFGVILTITAIIGALFMLAGIIYMAVNTELSDIFITRNGTNRYL